jgi:Rrf2 family protein
MLYSTSTKYAVMALMELAYRDAEKPVQIRDISESSGVPQHFLAKLVQTLVKAGILTSVKGRGGGVLFALPPAKVSLYDVVKAIDGPRALQNCIFGLDACEGERNCPIHSVWGPIRNQVMEFLQNTTVADLGSKLRRNGS